MINWLRKHHFLHDWEEWKKFQASYPSGASNDRVCQAWDVEIAVYDKKTCKQCGCEKIENITNKIIGSVPYNHSRAMDCIDYIAELNGMVRNRRDFEI